MLPRRGLSAGAASESAGAGAGAGSGAADGEPDEHTLPSSAASSSCSASGGAGHDASAAAILTSDVDIDAAIVAALRGVSHERRDDVAGTGAGSAGGGTTGRSESDSASSSGSVKAEAAAVSSVRLLRSLAQDDASFVVRIGSKALGGAEDALLAAVRHHNLGVARYGAAAFLALTVRASTAPAAFALLGNNVSNAAGLLTHAADCSVARSVFEGLAQPEAASCHHDAGVGEPELAFYSAISDDVRSLIFDGVSAALEVHGGDARVVQNCLHILAADQRWRWRLHHDDPRKDDVEAARRADQAAMVALERHAGRTDIVATASVLLRRGSVSLTSDAGIAVTRSGAHRALVSALAQHASCSSFSSSAPWQLMMLLEAFTDCCSRRIHHCLLEAGIVPTLTGCLNQWKIALMNDQSSDQTQTDAISLCSLATIALERLSEDEREVYLDIMMQTSDCVRCLCTMPQIAADYASLHGDVDELDGDRADDLRRIVPSSCKVLARLATSGFVSEQSATHAASSTIPAAAASSGSPSREIFSDPFIAREAAEVCRLVTSFDDSSPVFGGRLAAAWAGCTLLARLCNHPVPRSLLLANGGVAIVAKTLRELQSDADRSQPHRQRPRNDWTDSEDEDYYSVVQAVATALPALAEEMAMERSAGVSYEEAGLGALAQLAAHFADPVSAGNGDIVQESAAALAHAYARLVVCCHAGGAGRPQRAPPGFTSILATLQRLVRGDYSNSDDVIAAAARVGAEGIRIIASSPRLAPLLSPQRVGKMIARAVRDCDWQLHHAVRVDSDPQAGSYSEAARPGLPALVRELAGPAMNAIDALCAIPHYRPALLAQQQTLLSVLSWQVEPAGSEVFRSAFDALANVSLASDRSIGAAAAGCSATTTVTSLWRDSAKPWLQRHRGDHCSPAAASLFCALAHVVIATGSAADATVASPGEELPMGLGAFLVEARAEMSHYPSSPELQRAGHLLLHSLHLCQAAAEGRAAATATGSGTSSAASLESAAESMPERDNATALWAAA